MDAAADLAREHAQSQTSGSGLRAWHAQAGRSARRPAAANRRTNARRKRGRYVTLLESLGREVDAAFARHITINATGAIAALLLEIGIPVAAMRAYSVVSRAGGLVGHLLEEQTSHSGRAIWAAAKSTVPYTE